MSYCSFYLLQFQKIYAFMRGSVFDESLATREERRTKKSAGGGKLRNQETPPGLRNSGEERHFIFPHLCKIG